MLFPRAVVPSASRAVIPPSFLINFLLAFISDQFGSHNVCINEGDNKFVLRLCIFTIYIN